MHKSVKDWFIATRNRQTSEGELRASSVVQDTCCLCVTFSAQLEYIHESIQLHIATSCTVCENWDLNGPVCQSRW